MAGLDPVARKRLRVRISHHPPHLGRHRWVGWQLALKARGDRKVRGSTPLSSAKHGNLPELG
jgi:hypothetical protein